MPPGESEDVGDLCGKIDAIDRLKCCLGILVDAVYFVMDGNTVGEDAISARGADIISLLLDSPSSGSGAAPASCAEEGEALIPSCDGR